MKKLLLPQSAKVTPKEVLDEISKFEYINKSPYSLSYYNKMVCKEERLQSSRAGGRCS